MLYLDYNEKRVHGTKDFPIAFYHVDNSHPRYEMSFHWHEEYEIMRILKGTFHLMLADKEITAHGKECILIPGGAIHGGMPEDCEYECIVFHLDMLFLHNDTCRRYLKKIKHQDILIQPFITADMSSLRSAVDKIFTAVSKMEPGYELMVIGCLLELFGLIFQLKHYTVNDLNRESPICHAAQLKSVFEYIENHYASNITLKQLSQLSGMSPKYFCRYFQAITRRTPIDYLNCYRVERACVLLCTTDTPITSVAYDCGFNDCSYFIKLFKRYKHITPKQYQLQMRQ